MVELTEVKTDYLDKINELLQQLTTNTMTFDEKFAEEIKINT